MDIIQIIGEALREDLPDGDLTTDSLELGKKEACARVVAKEDLVFSGRELFERTLKTIDSELIIKWYFPEGELVLSGQILCSIEGRLSSILRGERTALNFLGRMSGIATLTRCFVRQVEHTKTKILDTRKTTPLLRTFEKKAVRDGQGQNHRSSLSDAILIKENHIRAAGGIRQAVERVRRKTSKPIEVEVTNLDEVKEALAVRAERLLLDNMDNSSLKECLELIPAAVVTEASGNMTVERVKSVAELGVTFISVGAITHSAPCADISLLIEWEEGLSDV